MSVDINSQIDSAELSSLGFVVTPLDIGILILCSFAFMRAAPKRACFTSFHITGEIACFATCAQTVAHGTMEFNTDGKS
jgi:hypothetical protein